MPRVIATSDFHGYLPVIKQPCDVLIIAGDVCPDHPVGKRQRYSLPLNGADFQLEWLDGPFRTWLSNVEAKHIIGIAGNHDFVFEKMETAVRELHLPWTYLCDGGGEWEGLSIWGTPWVPGLPRWAFYASERALQMRAESIPRNLDILISHGPPYGTLDFVAPQFGSTHVGDKPLANELSRINPKVLVCGHIHEQYGQERMPWGTRICNVSLNDEHYNPCRKVVHLEEFDD